MFLIDGKVISKSIEEQIALDTLKLINESGITPGLAVVLVGDDPASTYYVKAKEKACQRLGFKSVKHHLNEDTSQEELLALINTLNLDGSIHGILVQLPLPKQMDEQKVIETISPKKDVDGFHPISVGRMVIGLSSPAPCTPSGVIEMLIHNKIQTKGKEVVIVGRSNIVGKPLANLMLQKREGGDSIVTIAHSAADDLASITKRADILIVAIGKPNFITADMVKDNAIVIDVGINRIEDSSSEKGYRIVGDVDFENVKDKCIAITPVPGGVGLMTIAMLMKNTLRAAKGEFSY
ncbi:MAG: bifunctional methylenetetrahydrofolate dehydrogenase/methenyltetrahydrofolate cyclohydrolase FolD [Chlorobiota bacterium]|nr:bifunctional methylenetetrahydrofolate dehydrogenase/methenyltetrahydrofolate cyclohydrolase FolD [Chlorobiota bacterium]QQS65946.1 MAG: bifunctional methylenetetrahydrofolate dehydrogenase/methenyltetrahydrofolate cyclohydrolase FolD [Chlorobiota bacterium]